jgi:DNA-binding LacI/PurR family transcriptional regulator/signal transduction histidine kinase
VITPWLASDPYARAVVSGIAAGTRERRGSLICFALEWGDPSFYELMGKENIDGVIILAGTFVQAEGTDAFHKLCERLRPMPLVSVGIAVPGIANITADDATGVREAVRHLVRAHGMSRIAFARGPENSLDANARYRAYRDALAELGLPFDARLVTSGDFSPEAGRAAVERFLDGRHARPQAIVTADDSIALGALAALIDKGVSVPGEMAIIGFDDIEEAVPSALTTVNQKLREQGKQAARLLFDEIAGGSAERMLLPTALVIRRSCGCFPFAATSIVDRVSWTDNGSLRLAIEGQRTRIVEVMRAACLAAADWHGQLLGAFIDDLEGKEGYPFLSALDRALNRSASRGIELSDWEEVVLALGRTILPLLTESAARTRADVLLEKALLLIEEATKRAQAFDHLQTRTVAETMSAISQALIVTSDLHKLAKVLEEGLPPLSVRGCHVSLYETGSSGRRARLVLSFDGRQCRLLPSDEPTFPTGMLTPSDVLPADRPYETVVTPLSSQKSHPGLIVFEIDPGEATVYEELRWQLGATFARMEAEAELARLHAAEADRTRELEQAYAALKENQHRLLIAEKMASLGRLTAGIAHEMNTPLATVRAALEELRNLADDYAAATGDAGSKEQQDTLAREMADCIRMANRASARIAEFVKGIKFQTRDLASSDFHAFDPVPVVEETLLLINHLLRDSGCSVRFEHDGQVPRLYGAPVRFSQVVTNLMTNAIDASRPKGGGAIVLRLAPANGRVVFTITDAGVGIDPATASKIFDPMFTTKPFGEGTGLGLSIVHDIVTGDFNGSIEVESKPGEGTTFIVRMAEAPEGESSEAPPRAS